MITKKVKLAFITKESARKATFKKRKKGLMKKVSELSTLCGVDATAIIYSPYDSQPEIWPNTLGVERVISQFKRMPEMEQSKKMLNQESFIKQRIAKANEQLKKQNRDNREKEMTEIIYQCLSGKGMIQNLMMRDLKDLGCLLDQKLKEIFKRIEFLKKMVAAPANYDHQPAAQLQQVQEEEEKPAATAADLSIDGGVQRPQWLSDWMNNSAGENIGFGHHQGKEMMMMQQFHDNNHINPMWSSAFFPRKIDQVYLVYPRGYLYIISGLFFSVLNS